MVGVSALLALVVPASIARTSLVGAYVIIAVLAVTAGFAVRANARRPRSAAPRAVARTGAYLGLALATGVYVAVVTLIHLAR